MVWHMLKPSSIAAEPIDCSWPSLLEYELIIVAHRVEACLDVCNLVYLRRQYLPQDLQHYMRVCAIVTLIAKLVGLKVIPL